MRLNELNQRKIQEELQLKEEEIRLENLREQKIIQARILEEKRIKDEEERIKEWERKFDRGANSKRRRID